MFAFYRGWCCCWIFCWTDCWTWCWTGCWSIGWLFLVGTSSSHSLVSTDRCPVMMMLLVALWTMVMVVESKIAWQPASQSNPIDMSECVLRSGKGWDICDPALMEGNHSSGLWVEWITWLLATATGINGETAITFLKMGWSMISEGGKRPVEPESPTALIFVAVFAWCRKVVDDVDGDDDEEEGPMWWCVVGCSGVVSCLILMGLLARGSPRPYYSCWGFSHSGLAGCSCERRQM